MRRVLNFSAGPAVLPEEVIAQIQAEIFDWQGSGMSVMEMSHRSFEFESIMNSALTDLMGLLDLGDEYEILFMQGGATAQFATVPMNLMTENNKADYVYTGQWGKKAIKEAKKFGSINIAASSEDRNFSYIPEENEWKLDTDADYVHITSNETIGGVEFHWTPDTGDIPLVSDMSSHFLSRTIDVSKYGVIYAGAQKNVGPAGLTIVIIRKDLVGRTEKTLPAMQDYKVFAENRSMSNTPPCYSIYVAGLVFKWLKRKGGLEGIEKINIFKSQLLYEYLDGSDFYQTPVDSMFRSRMNVPFKTNDVSTNEKFLVEARANDLCELKGHRSVGGMRASIYNAMSVDGVKILIDFMKEFERKNG